MAAVPPFLRQTSSADSFIDITETIVPVHLYARLGGPGDNSRGENQFLCCDKNAFSQRHFLPGRQCVQKLTSSVTVFTLLLSIIVKSKAFRNLSSEMINEDGGRYRHIQRFRLSIQRNVQVEIGFLQKAGVHSRSLVPDD